ncbi:hypothetical protein SPRG_18670 [Saprolegnia parasitica CBS 223.65]|uniref:Macro domain-containing protein n=1 Tax=Saprolegnia parasitica (strain CBS 223.65) TaxID=695850 RepID=A0A067BGD7_SAPPC|nr:hypothetical protein SPRG_18670 [Saprolegnia parasitica CBS 223.65]KDO15795.1 hypothetical protein SPRG_18670 [Saprolegnia parasitica CBS 223.65]|eukprot:XP_012213498.1 hypothetical protein SPRG_18670 [Saprolegnia parasitica CBS 223.65]
MKRARTGPSATGRGLACLEIPDVCKAILSYCLREAAQCLSVVVLSKATTRSVAEYQELWTDLIIAHYGKLRSQPAVRPCSSGNIPVAAPGYAPCTACVEYFETAVERSILQRLVILRGDIQTIAHVQGQALDCLVFPTNTSLKNHGLGAAAAVFRRAGLELDGHIARLHYTGSSTASAVVTPGFSANVTHLLLYATYIKAFQHCLSLDVSCLAIASISTGSLGFPPTRAARQALRAYRDFVKTYRWRATVAIVCLDMNVAASLEIVKAKLLKRFNKHCRTAVAPN